MMSCTIVIPARLDATRLPRKPLLDIGGVPMCVSVAKRAIAANIGRVIVACCGDEIAHEVKKHGVDAIVTDPTLQSGTDRVFAAMQFEPKTDFVINLQGDLPLVDPKILSKLIEFSKSHPNFDITTPVCKVDDAGSNNKVKVVMTNDSKALYFSRSNIPYGASSYFEHVGIYMYKYESLKKFVSLPSSYLEKCEKLEQLRALENGMSIGCCIIDSSPQSVDTIEDYLVVLSQIKNID